MYEALSRDLPGAAGTVRITPERAVFFDDRKENVEAASKEGIRGVLFHKDIPLQFLSK